MTERPPKQSLKLVSRRGFDPPRPLGKHGMSLWCRITSAYNVADAGGVELLTLACQALDRAERLREQIDADGEIVRYRTGMRAPGAEGRAGEPRPRVEAPRARGVGHGGELRAAADRGAPAFRRRRRHEG